MLKVLILRGLPGSGKTTYMYKHLAKFQSSSCKVEIFSADNFWVKDGSYNYDPKRIGEAHAWCYKGYLECLAYRTRYKVDGEPNYLLTIDNTNISAYEVAPYVLAASSYGIEHKIITLWCDPLMAAKRNVHDVPPEIVLKMWSKMLSAELPPFWKHEVIYSEDE